MSIPHERTDGTEPRSPCTTQKEPEHRPKGEEMRVRCSQRPTAAMPTTAAATAAPRPPPRTALPDTAPLLGLADALGPVEPDAAVLLALALVDDDPEEAADSVEMAHLTFEGREKSDTRTTSAHWKR